jgi:RND family efflux transporter MFP subunit
MNVDSQSKPASPAFFLAPKLTNRRKSAIGLAMIVMVCGVTVSGRWLLASSAESRKVKPAVPPPLSVRVVELHDEVVVGGIRYSAVVKELRKAELSFRVAGTVSFLHQVALPGRRTRNLHEGDKLKEGEVLAELDKADYVRARDIAAGRLASARAKLAQAHADEELAKIEYRRAEMLKRRNALSDSEEDTARAKLQTTAAAESSAQCDVQTAEVQLAQAEAELGYCTIRNPFPEGTLSYRYVEKDERIAVGQRSFLLVDVSSVVISFMVPDTLVGRLTNGQSIGVSSDALPGHEFRGVVHKIGASADSQTRTYPIEVRVDRPDGLRPGMVANVHFRHEQRAFLLPLTAIAPGSAGNQRFEVYRVESREGKSIARLVNVSLDDVVDNRVAVRVGVDDPLKAGDRIIAAGIHRLHEGEAVQIVE